MLRWLNVTYFVLAGASSIFVTAGLARAQCTPQWDPYFGNPGSHFIVFALEVFDDGTGCGPALFLGKGFEGNGVISKWDGQRWHVIGVEQWGIIKTLQTWDDGSGSALFAGGSFWPEGMPSVNVAKWDGTQWLPLGYGLGCDAGGAGSDPRCPPLLGEAVEEFTIHDDGLGGGPALYAVGDFDITDNYDNLNNVAKWNGKEWLPVGLGVAGTRLKTVVSYVTGTAPADLYVGGSIFNPEVGILHIAKWNGVAWSGVGGGTDGDVFALKVFDEDGDGPMPPVLFVGGVFTTAGGVPCDGIARWNGAAWTPVGGGLTTYKGKPGSVRAMTVYDDGTGPALYVSGGFIEAGAVPANAIAKWDGSQWSALGNGLNSQARSFVTSGLSDSDDFLYMAGSFTSAGGNPVEYVARWGCPVSPICTADVYPECEGDDIVNVDDLLFMIGEWGKVGGPADVVNDATININDLLALIGSWGPCS